MAVLDEGRHLADTLARIATQEYDGSIRTVIALGPSRDSTDAIAALAAEKGAVLTVDNPSGSIPAGLNAAIAALPPEVEVVARVDARAMIPATYVATAVRLLGETGADNVGGAVAAEGAAPFERAVACAMRSRLGVGAASFRTGGAAGEADTVYLGVFRRSTLDRIGGYDEAFTRTQDWELNHRIRATGGQVWFSPDLSVPYRPRASLRRLAHGYDGYGRWRRAVVRRHPETLSMRYLAAPIALLGIALGTILGLLGAVLGLPAAAAGWVLPVGYFVLVAVGGIWVARGERWSVRLRMPLVLATMHLCWGWGFLTSRVRVPAAPGSAV